MIWFLAIALLVVPGMVAWRLPLVRQMPLSSRLGVAFACGVLVNAVVMFAYALLGVRWTALNVTLALLALTVVIVSRVGGEGSRTSKTEIVRFAQDDGIQTFFLALFVYAIADARATCGDLMFIWAPKAQAFFNARTIDLNFLSFPHYYLMHPDYPPLVPFTYAFGSLFANHFSWYGALFVSVLVVAAIVLMLRGFGAPPAAVTLATAILTFGFVAAYLPGGADPFLLLFESAAVIALTFAHESRDARLIATVALAGAAFSKVEGASFAVVVAVAYALTHRNMARAAALLITPVILLGAWLLFAWQHGLLDQYARARTSLHVELIGLVVVSVVKRASFHALWVPWIAAAAPLVVTRSLRAAALPLLVAAGCIAAAAFFYLHNPDPAYWIASSAERILVTPLMCLAIASAAAFPRIIRAR